MEDKKIYKHSIIFNNMTTIPHIKTGESEIDFLIIEELFSNLDFQKWLISKLNLEENFKFVGAWKSFNGRYGECDVATEFIINGKRVMILIENKIYSSEQPQQAERYHKTGNDLIKNKGINKYITCLLSPNIYFKEDAPMKLYEHKISYEELLDWFKNQANSERIKFKQMVIQNGIKRARTGYQRITDENTNKFYNYYENIAREIHPELEYKKPKEVASGNSWIRFNPKIFPSKITIIHKARQGYIDLQISDMDIIEFSNNFKNKLANNMSLHKTGKSISIRIIVPKIPNLEDIDEPEKYRNEIIEILNNVSILMEWYVENMN